MSRYNIIQAIFMSFFSPKLYRDVALNWGGKAFLYLFFLLFLAWIFPVYKMQLLINQFAEQDTSAYVAQIPVLTIKDGKLSTPENRPYEVINPDTKQKIAVIDTSGTNKTIEDAKSVILVTQTEIITQTKPNEVKTNQIPTFINNVIDPQQAVSFLKGMLKYSWIGLFSALLIVSFIYRVFQSMIYSIIGKVFSAISGANVTYVQCLQIMMVALTPVIIIGTVLDVLGIIFPFQMLFYFVLAMAYLFFGILANKNKAAPI